LFERKRGFILLLFNSEYAFRGVQAFLEGLKLNGTNQFLIYTDDANILGGIIYIIKKYTENLVAATSIKEIRLIVSAEKTKRMIKS
jgi:hypothetical protein